LGISLIITNCTEFVLSLKDLVLYCGLGYTLEDMVQVEVVPLAVHFRGPHSLF